MSGGGRWEAKCTSIVEEAEAGFGNLVLLVLGTLP